jgi:hypothetical protein
VDTETCTDPDHTSGHGDEIVWTAVTDTLPSEKGNYYLTQDVTITKTWTPEPDTALCLNGHTITITGQGDSGVINAWNNFTLTDCSNETHYGQWNDGMTEYTISDDPPSSGTYDELTGGMLRDTTGKNVGIVVKNELNMYGGNLVGFQKNAISVSSTFHMYGGTLAGNRPDSEGVVVIHNSVFTMYGGLLTDNYAADNAGAVYAKTRVPLPWSAAASPEILGGAL